MQRIIRDCYKQLYANKMDNQEETNRFLERYSLLRLNQEEIESINGSIKSIKNETVIKDLSTNKIQDEMDSQVNSAKHLAKS